MTAHDGRGSAPPQALEITVGDLASEPKLAIGLRRVAGEAGLGRPIRHPRVQKSGLALAGHFHGVVPTRVQVLGETEISYLSSLTPDGRSVASRGLLSLGLSCVVITGDHEPARALLAAAEATSTPLFVSDGRSSRTINALHALLDDRLAPQTQLHGVLVDVFGVGILLLGKSGIGKSECALELVMRNHRLVADDVVRCDWRPPGMVFGQAADLLRHHVEIRGLGVLNIKELFGVTSVRERKRIDLVVHLVEWDEKDEYDRLGLEDRYHTVLGTPIRDLVVPVRPGRDMGSILEMAARNELLRRGGTDTAQEFLNRVESALIARPALEADQDSPGDARVAPTSGASTAQNIQGQRIPAERPTWSNLVSAERVNATESSAWIPAVRPKPEGDE